MWAVKYDQCTNSRTRGETTNALVTSLGVSERPARQDSKQERVIQEVTEVMIYKSTAGLGEINNGWVSYQLRGSITTPRPERGKSKGPIQTQRKYLWLFVEVNNITTTQNKLPCLQLSVDIC